MTKIGVIIQARRNSTRFPDKVLADLNGSPVIQHVIDRCLQFNKNVILAVPYADTGVFSKFGVPVYYGPEHDVLERYYKCALAYQLETIVRITSDCPLIQPHLCSQVIDLFHNDCTDYAAIDHPHGGWPKGYGVEVFSWRALDMANLFAYQDYDKEHVTPWIQRYIQHRCKYLMNTRDDSALNYCIDTREDLERLKNKT